MVEVGVEVFTLGNINTIWGLVMVAGQEVVNVVDTSGSKSDLRQIDGPDTTISILGLYNNDSIVI